MGTAHKKIYVPFEAKGHQHMCPKTNGNSTTTIILSVPSMGVTISDSAQYDVLCPKAKHKYNPFCVSPLIKAIECMV